MENNLTTLNTIPENSFTFLLKNEPIIIIDEKGFKYNGELIQDSGEIYELFKKFLKSSNNFRENTFTEEQVREAYMYGRSMMNPKNFEKYIQSLKQSK